MKSIESLKNTRQFQQVYKLKKSNANRLFIMYIRKNEFNYHRLGISVSKKVGNSVVRHRFSRLVREVFRLNKQNIKEHYDLIIIVRSNANDHNNYEEFKSAFEHLLKIHHIYK